MASTSQKLRILPIAAWALLFLNLSSPLLRLLHSSPAATWGADAQPTGGAHICPDGTPYDTSVLRRGPDGSVQASVNDTYTSGVWADYYALPSDRGSGFIGAEFDKGVGNHLNTHFSRKEGSPYLNLLDGGKGAVFNVFCSKFLPYYAGSVL